MGPGPLLLALPAVQIERIRFTPHAVILDVASTATCCCCPACGQRSIRVHSHYRRRLQDLPAHGRSIELNVRLPRFFCDHRDCPRQTFAQPLADVAASHARRTGRLTAALRDIAFAAGGEGGGRLAEHLAMPASPDTLLRLTRHAPVQEPGQSPEVLGVDDWAIRRGQRYGTILCDLKLHCPIELLLDRSCEILAAWLKDHPGARFIARDRGGDYARGATLGAPDAIQIADRWHLLSNLSEAFKRAVERHHAVVAQAAPRATIPPPARAQEPMAVGEDAAVVLASSDKPAGIRQHQEHNRARRLERFQQVKRLEGDGLSLRQIADQMKLDRSTVRRWTAAGSFPERAAAPRRRTTLDPFAKYLRFWWQMGCHNSARLYRKLKELGYQGSYFCVRRRVRVWRAQETAASPSPQASPASADQPIGRPSARTVAWWLIEEQRPRTQQQQGFLSELHRLWPQLADNVTLVREFRRLLREHQADSLEAWVELAGEKTIVGEIRRFAAALRKDWAAVLEAVRSPWSNGQLEGQINRLKLIKRQMYGRANFDLLRKRVLHDS